MSSTQIDSTAEAAGYAGFELDHVSGLSLAQYRSYDSDLGRWISEDPAKFVDGPNLFSYVTNRPITHIDPAGLQGTMSGAPKVVRTPKLPTACPATACGCTEISLDAGFSCSCTDGGYQLSLRASFTATIYINTRKWTPESWIESHERGHVNDYVETTTWFLNQTGGVYPTERACERAGGEFQRQMRQRLRAQSLQRDNFFAELMCW
jgi:RHS repeat-associated protein